MCLFFLLCVHNHFKFVAVGTRTFAYVVLSANCDKIICGLFKSMLAIPISPLASPLPSTKATMTDGACADTAEDEAGNGWQVKHTYEYERLFVLLHIKPQSPESSHLYAFYLFFDNITRETMHTDQPTTNSTTEYHSYVPPPSFSLMNPTSAACGDGG